MAPRTRGRPRKRPLARMDAAIDAMKPYGFDRGIVVKTIKELQKVYGEEGWPFIEEGSYKVLLEAILEKVNGGETNDSKKPDGETSMALEPTCSGFDAYPPTTTLHTSTALIMDPPSETNEAMGTTKLATEPEGEHLLPVEARGSKPERLHVQQPLSNGQPTFPGSTEKPPQPDGKSTGQSSSHSHSHSHSRSHRPYYGWIDGDEEEPDLVVFRPGPFGQEMENWLAGLRRQKPRKQRWDVKPDGM